MNRQHYLGSFLLLILLSACSTTPAPFTVVEGLFNFSQPETLGLANPPGIHTANAFIAQKGKHQYNHGAVLIAFKDNLYLQWQSSLQDEDAADTQVLMSISTSGDEWSSPRVLVGARDDAVVTNGGWWTDGETLVAFINVWPASLTPRGSYVEYITSTDGTTWSSPKPVLNHQGQPVLGAIEQDLKRLPSGRILTAVHEQPGLIVKPYFTDDPLGIRGWQAGAMENLPHDPGISREIEPSWFVKKDDDIVMVFRDQASSFRVIASSSSDNGKSWTPPQLTNMPDSRAKQSAGNLPCRKTYLVNNPSGSKNRMPLTVTLSNSGDVFDHAFLLRSEEDLPPMRYAGKYKRAGYSYPKSLVWNGHLWISYAVNKEDIAVTRVLLESLCAGAR